MKAWGRLSSGTGASHWWGLKVVELQVWPGGWRGLAQQQDGQQQQQQQAQDGCGDYRVLADSGRVAGEAEGGPRETGLTNVWHPHLLLEPSKGHT